jgi:hypothetical protein
MEALRQLRGCRELPVVMRANQTVRAKTAAVNSVFLVQLRKIRPLIFA